MKLIKYSLRNFRRLEAVEIELEGEETIFVGPNNSGKTSAAVAFRYFVVRNSPFSIFDFSASQIETIDKFGTEEDLSDMVFPSIDMDLWFSVDPETEYGRIANLLTVTSLEHSEIGLSISLIVKDVGVLREEYFSVFPKNDETGVPEKTLSHFLSLSGNFKRHFSLNYASLEMLDGEVNYVALDKEEGVKAINSLLRIDFIDAQRNIDDQEIGRSNRLSTAFAAFYKKNLDQVEANEAANKVIDKNNDELTEHYGEHFSDLLGVIKGLGVPSANDRELKILSTLKPDEALKGNTELHYIDTDSQHELPEAYNGLGFKNLIFMAIQASHFQLQWMRTEVNRPLCQVILIEEPEVHLHAQVQKTFIAKIWEIAREEAKKYGEEKCLPQFVVTTHSSHIVDEIAFEKIRYFRRCVSGIPSKVKSDVKKASKVLSLHRFQLDSDEEENLRFLRRYLKLTHCDLFFADAVILVEGTVEKLLMPTMIKESAPELQRIYITTLEVGGAYAHRFSCLLSFLQIPYLVITDIDSIDPANGRKVCRADTSGAKTSNASIKHYLDKELITDLVGLVESDLICDDEYCFVAYQHPVEVCCYEDGETMHGRTFEETFIYENIDCARDGRLDVLIELSKKPDFEADYETVYESVKSKNFKKVEFALNLIDCDINWQVPSYIVDGLKWLEVKTR